MKALREAAGRGVDVKLVLPGHSDSSLTMNAGRYHYSELLKSRVKIYERRKVLLHAKTAVIDGVWSTVGSTNMDFWSFSSNDEVNAVIVNKAFAAEMEKMFAADLAESDEIRLEEWKKRPILDRLKESPVFRRTRSLPRPLESNEPRVSGFIPRIALSSGGWPLNPCFRKGTEAIS